METTLTLKESIKEKIRDNFLKLKNKVVIIDCTLLY